MDAITNILHLLLQFAVSLATLIINFLVQALQLLLHFIQGLAGTAQ